MSANRRWTARQLLILALIAAAVAYWLNPYRGDEPTINEPSSEVGTCVSTSAH